MAYRQGVGPDRLPQGAAQQVNANQLGPEAFENQQIPVQFAPEEPEPIPNDDSDLASDDLQILMEGPDPGYQPKVTKERKGRVPKFTVRHIAHFRTAATAPDAPPGLRALYNATTAELEAEYRQGR